MTSPLFKWPVFSVLNEEMVNNIRLAIVFGISANAIYITDDDQAFALGLNRSGCLGLDKTLSCIQPMKINELSDIRVKSLAFGLHDEHQGTHLLALTESGRVWSWGSNEFHQLGNGTTDSSGVPAEVSGLTGHRIVQVACGALHCLALTSGGEVFGWGMNNKGQVGSFSTTNQKYPVRITNDFEFNNVVAIACSHSSSMALTNTGDLYVWGFNENGVLGLINNNNQLAPTRVDSLAGVNIVQLACGHSHVLALAEDGSVYAWGKNHYGQLGTGDTIDQNKPVKIEPDGLKFVEVAAGLFNNLSVAVSDDGLCWAWGQCRNDQVLKPLILPVTSIHDVFAGFALPAVTPKPIIVSFKDKKRLYHRMKEAFDHPETSDLKIIVENQTIYVHRSVLKIHSQYLRTMLDQKWSKSDKDEIELDDYTYPVYHALFKYLYTDQVDLQPEQAINLLEVANLYGEDDLKNKCDEIIRPEISIDNVTSVYEAAIRFETKPLEDFCFNFIIDHFNEVALTSEFKNSSEKIKLFEAAASILRMELLF